MTNHFWITWVYFLITVILYFHRNVASVVEVFNFVNKVLCLFNKSFSILLDIFCFLGIPQGKVKMTSRGELAPFVVGWIGTGANYLEKYLLSMVLNLTVNPCVRNFISSFISKKPGEILIFRPFFGAKTQFRPIFHCKSLFWAKSTLWRHTWDVCTVYWYVWKEETRSYNMVPNKHTSGVHFSSSQGKIAWLDEG